MKRGLFTKLNLHLFLLAIVVAADAFLGVRFALAWRAIRSDQSSEFVREEARLGQLEAQMRHLNGLPKKVDVADQDAQKFYEERVAPNYSTILAQLGAVATKNSVRLSRAAYAEKPAPSGLTELDIDAGLSGPYSNLMHFINGIERDQDHVFFIINGVTLNGQQGGLVNLRLRMTTYIHAGATDLPTTITDTNLQPAPGPSPQGQSEGPQ
jgi:type IV pilus assembly protein PilO